MNKIAESKLQGHKKYFSTVSMLADNYLMLGEGERKKLTLHRFFAILMNYA